MRIEDLQNSERIALRVIASDRRQAIEAVATAFVQANPRLEHDQVFDSLLERESLATTGIGDGVAIPHARLPGLSETEFVVATCPEGLEFGSVDGEPVTILVGVLSPAERPREGIRALSDVARRLGDRAVRDRLVAADTRQEVVDALGDAHAALLAMA